MAKVKSNCIRKRSLKSRIRLNIRNCKLVPFKFNLREIDSIFFFLDEELASTEREGERLRERTNRRDQIEFTGYVSDDV